MSHCLMSKDSNSILKFREYFSIVLRHRHCLMAKSCSIKTMLTLSNWTLGNVLPPCCSRGTCPTGSDLSHCLMGTLRGLNYHPGRAQDWPKPILRKTCLKFPLISPSHFSSGEFDSIDCCATVVQNSIVQHHYLRLYFEKKSFFVRDPLSCMAILVLLAADWYLKCCLNTESSSLSFRTCAFWRCLCISVGQRTRSSAETLWVRHPPWSKFGERDSLWRTENMTPSCGEWRCWPPKKPSNTHQPTCRVKPLKCDSVTGNRARVDWLHGTAVFRTVAHARGRQEQDAPAGDFVQNYYSENAGKFWGKKLWVWVFWFKSWCFSGCWVGHLGVFPSFPADILVLFVCWGVDIWTSTPGHGLGTEIPASCVETVAASLPVCHVLFFFLSFDHIDKSAKPLFPKTHSVSWLAFVVNGFVLVHMHTATNMIEFVVLSCSRSHNSGLFTRLQSALYSSVRLFGNGNQIPTKSDLYLLKCQLQKIITLWLGRSPCHQVPFCIRTPWPQAQFTQDVEHLATVVCKWQNTLWSMGVFTQLNCKQAYASCVNGAWGLRFKCAENAKLADEQESDPSPPKGRSCHFWSD